MSLRESDRAPPALGREGSSPAEGRRRVSEQDLEVGAVEELLFGWLKG